MTKFIFKILIISIPFCLIVSLTNYIIDPANIFNNGKVEKQVANIILKGNNAKGVMNYDERLVFEHIAKNINPTPETIVLGTSRLLGVRKKHIDSLHFFNYALSKCNIHDYIAQIGLLDSLNKLPKEIFFDVTPLLSSKEDGTNWISLYQYHKYLVQKINLEKVAVIENPSYYFFKKKANALTSLQYFQSSIIRYRKKITTKKVEDVVKLGLYEKGKLSDGSITLPEGEKAVDTMKLLQNLQVFVASEGIPDIDINKLNNFIKISKYLQLKNVKVNFLVIPYQTDIYNYMTEYFNIIESRLHEVSKSNNIGFYGTFNPVKVGLNRSNFYDNLHCNNNAYDLFFNYIKPSKVSNSL